MKGLALHLALEQTHQVNIPLGALQSQMETQAEEKEIKHVGAEE